MCSCWAQTMPVLGLHQDLTSISSRSKPARASNSAENQQQFNLEALTDMFPPSPHRASAESAQPIPCIQLHHQTERDALVHVLDLLNHHILGTMPILTVHNSWSCYNQLWTGGGISTICSIAIKGTMERNLHRLHKLMVTREMNSDSRSVYLKGNGKRIFFR